MSQNIHATSLDASLADATLNPASPEISSPSSSPLSDTPAPPVASNALPSHRLSAPSLAFLKSPNSLRWIRFLATCCFIISSLALILTLQRNLDLRFKQSAFLGIGSGCFQIGFNESRFWFTQEDALPPSASAPLIDLAVTPSYYSDWTIAWRPFRVKTVSSKFLVVPLWPAVLGTLTVAAWSHGRLSGLRAARTNSCHACGYDLAAINAHNGQRTCPECGKIHAGR
jgi:hypothetical protein